MKTWILSEKSGRRFRQGHPWVFANELTESPKGLAPGSPVELRSTRGQFLARGYGNPNSLICFRTLSRREGELDPWSSKRLTEKVRSAHHWRQQLGLRDYSHRLIFGEADRLPGLVMDRFVNQDQSQQVFVLQILTAGAEVLLPEPAQWVNSWAAEITGVNKTKLVVRRDVGTRKLEGLEIGSPQLFDLEQGGHQIESFDFSTFPAWVRSSDGTDSGVTFDVDLVTGQKTGFFFDQASNLELLIRSLKTPLKGDVRVLDLFCYVGQWGTQVARHLKNQGATPHLHFVDGSKSALALAEKNASPFSDRVTCHELDILEGLRQIPESDIVICDPPAFIKSKKDHGPGLRGYLKANTLALEKVRSQGFFVSCSCSHHLSDQDMAEMLKEAEIKANRRVRWLGRGIQAPDHPVLLSFPEGQYLKAWIGQVE